jgi:hypothetical protein
MVDFKAISRNIIKKWIGIPYALILVVSATSVENIPERWQHILASKGHNNELWIMSVFLAGYL